MNKSLIGGLFFLMIVLLVGMIGSGVFAQDPVPTEGAFQLTTTQIVINATNRVLTPFSMPSMPPDLTYLPGVDPLTMRLANQATKFAMDQAANPTPDATIEGCSPEWIIQSNNFELQDKFQVAFLEADLPVLVSVYQMYVTEDCVTYSGSPYSITLSLTEDYDQSSALITKINETIQVFLAQGIEVANIELHLGPVPDGLGRTLYKFRISAIYADLLANYQDGLQGLDLFLPRG